MIFRNYDANYKCVVSYKKTNRFASMKIWDEQKKKKLKNILLRTGISAGALVLLYLILTSSFMICYCYLPIISDYLDAEISARSVKFNLFGEKNIRVKDLDIKLKDHLSCKVVRLNANVNLRELFHGLIKLERISAKKTELIIREFPDSDEKQWTDRLTRDRLQIGDAEVENFTIRRIPKNSPRFWRVHFDNISGENLISESPGTIRFNSRLVWNMPDTSVLDFPATGTINYELSNQIFPTSFSGSVDTEHPDGNKLKQELKNLRFHADFAGRMIEEQNLFLLDSFQVKQRSVNASDMHLTAKGTFNLFNRDGDFDIHFTAVNSNLPLLKMYFGKDISPKKTNLDLNAKLHFSQNGISCEAALNGVAAELQTRDGTILKNVACNVNLNTDFQEKNRTLHFRMLNTKITHDKNTPLADMHTDGVFSLKWNEDDTWDINAEKASLNVNLSAFPLKLLNPFIPFHIHSGSLDGKYTLNTNNVQQKIMGNINCKVQDLTVIHKYFSVTVPLQFQLSAGLQTEGLTRISAMKIDGLQVKMFSNNKLHSQLELSGEHHLTKNLIDLKGKFYFSPTILLKKMIFPLAGELKENLDMNANDELWTGETKIRANLNTNEINVQGSSLLATDMIPDIKIPDKDIRIDFDTDLSLKSDSCLAQIKSFTLNIPERIDAKLSGLVRFPELAVDLDLRMDEMQPLTFRELREMVEYEKNFIPNLLETLDYKMLSGAAKISWDEKDNILCADEAHLTFHFENGKQGSMFLDYPLTLDLNTNKFTSTDVVVDMKNLPFRVTNFFLGKNSRHAVKDSLVNGTLTLTIENDLSRVPVKGDFTVDRVRMKISDLNFDFGRTRIYGHGFLHDNFKSLHYKKTQVEICRINDQQKKPVLFVDTHGKMLFVPPFTATHNFHYSGMDEHIMKYMMPDLSGWISMKKLNADGSLIIQTSDHNSRVNIRCKHNIKDLALPQNNIHGSIFFDMILQNKNIPEINLKQADISLYSKENNKIFDLSLNGIWKKTKNLHQTKCNINSDVADWKAIHGLFVKMDQPENKAEKTEKEKKKVVQKTDKKTTKETKWIEKEPGRIDFSGFSTKININIKNWTYGAIRFQADGTLNAQDNQLLTKDFRAAFNRDATFRMNAAADFGENDGWELSCDFDANDLDIAPFALELLKDEEKKKKFSGHIKMLKFRGKTKGISLQNLNKNLDLAIFAELDHFSFPMLKEEKADTIKLLMLPLTLLPQLVDHLPGPLARPMQKFISGDLWMALSGTKNLEISKAQIYMRSAEKGPRTDLEFKKCLFSGNSYGFATKKMKVNPFTKAIHVDSTLAIAALKYPLVISGTLDEPELDHKVLNTLSESLGSVFSIKQNGLWNFMPPPEL